MLIKKSLSGFVNKVYTTASSIIVPFADMVVPKHNNVLLVFGRPDGDFLVPGRNIITDDGDLYYAQKSAGETPTNDFAAGIIELASAGAPGKSADRSAFTPIANTQKTLDATYPKTNDGDADNTAAGTDIVTYLTSYTKADFNSTGITHGFITLATPAANEVILAGFSLPDAPFQKTANDTLKVFVNHQMNGV